jgi:ankyrin repeat protein
MTDQALEDWLRAENFSGLFARGDNNATPLMRAAQKGDATMAKKILAAGGDILRLSQNPKI